ncbi:bud site selection protein [Coemansia sp. RSA 1813]|nr:bud site selection protein [Coemansia sp. RSA 1843]KAJ2088704.1 bud site selection protein [Coemansia sp. RSA 986]KAJ2213677.1 bud site selection protein [Coemansia sp. RSA 487]KAJ2568606.1 bud site selection protein [Coemansia sp. RSA 1813]
MAYTDCLQDAPDIFENVIGESIAARTDGLGMIRELGPPDLCHIIKAHSSNRNEAEIGSYHHVLGVDTSSSASLAAYINSLQYLLSDSPGWFGANNNWRISSGTYCTYNSFSNIDLRVQIKIPGGVDAYAVNARGERTEITEQMWKEIHVCSVIRAILYSDPATYSVTGLRRLTPIASLDEENRFVDSVIQQFWDGLRLGSNAETQMASTARNHMVDGIIKYFSGQERFADCAAEILAPLAYAPLGGQRSGHRSSADFKGIDPEVASLLAEMYIKGDQEVQAVRVMHQALRVKPSCYPMLNAQAEFLRRKKKLDAALVISRMAVKYAPSEFNAWAKLTEIYIERGDFQRALLTLNTCPMYTFVDHDLPRVPSPRRVNYIFNSDILSEYNLGENLSNAVHGPVPSNNRSSVDSDAPGIAEEMDLNERSEILRLPAPSLKGTFAKAYHFLAQIVSTIGWDELLHLRSQAFVMEEEYKSTAKPNVAIDDEDASGDLHDEDDHVPLSVLSQRNSAVKLDADPDTAEEVPTLADAPVENTNKVAVNGDASNKEEVQENENEPNASAPAREDSVVEQKQEQKQEQEQEHQSIDEQPSEKAKEEEQEAPATEKEPADQPKGKKKKKNKKGKSKDASAKNTAMVNGAADDAAKPEADSKDATEDGESHDRSANGEAKESTIAALGGQMEDVSLDDKKDDNDETAAISAPDVPAPEDAKPAETLTSPRNAVFDIKPTIAEVTPGPNHQNSQQDETKTIEDEPQDGSNGSSEDPTYIRKRLCERWLDNHIMILYEDLRMYTAWRYRMDNLRATGQPVMYQYTQAEWEALGDLALRMHRPSDAKEAFEYALGIRFSARAWMRLLEMYTGTYADMQKEEALRNEGISHVLPAITSTDSLVLALDAVVWLSVFGYRWHNSMTYPNPVCNQFIRLVRIHGLSKVRNSLVSMNLKTPVLNIVKGYFEIAEKFDVTGAKW